MALQNRGGGFRRSRAGSRWGSRVRARGCRIQSTALSSGAADHPAPPLGHGLGSEERPFPPCLFPRRRFAPRPASRLRPQSGGTRLDPSRPSLVGPKRRRRNAALAAAGLSDNGRRRHRRSDQSRRQRGRRQLLGRGASIRLGPASDSVESGDTAEDSEQASTSVAEEVGPAATQGPGTLAPPSTPLTVPASTAPASTVPASTVPASTVPASTVPASTVAASTVAASTVAASTVPASTVPASTVPASTVPASTVPASTAPLTVPASTAPPTVPASTIPPSTMPVASAHWAYHVVTSVAWSPDGSTLATTSGDQSLRLWNRATGAAPLALRPTPTSFGRACGPPTARGSRPCLRRPTAPVGPPSSEPIGEIMIGAVSIELAWSPDAKSIAVARHDGVVELRNVADGRDCEARGPH